jgi:hypothetical protein
VRYVVELRDDVVQKLRTGKAVLGLYLGREVAEDDHSGHLWADQHGPHEEFEVLEPLGVAEASARVGRRDKESMSRGGWHSTHFGSAASNSRMTRSV